MTLWSAAWLGMRQGRALVCCLLTAPCWGAPALGLEAALEAAWVHDPHYRAARAEQQAGLEHAPIGRARVLPSVTAVASLSRNSATVTSAEGVSENRGDYRSGTRSIQLRQPLYDPEAWAVKRQGEARARASEATFRGRRQELLVRVFDAYASAVLAQEEVSWAQAQLSALEEQWRANERRYQLGEGTLTDMLETGAKRALAQVRLLEAQDQERSRRVALEVLTGQSVAGVWRLPVLTLAAPPGDDRPLDAWQALALDRSAELNALRDQAEVARQELARLQGVHHPKLDLLMSQGRSQSDTTATFRQTSQTRTLGLQLNLPLYAGGGVSAQVRQAAALWQKALADVEAKEAELTVELHRQHALHTQGGMRVRALAEAFDSAVALVRATEKSVAGGERTNADVLAALERLSQVERDLAEARVQQITAGVRLKTLTGMLTPDDLMRLSHWWAPPPHSHP